MFDAAREIPLSPCGRGLQSKLFKFVRTRVRGMNKTPTYAEFAVTTNFSFLRGASHPEELVDRAKTLGLAGIGIADRNSVAGVVRTHQAAKEAGLKFAPGAR